MLSLSGKTDAGEKLTSDAIKAEEEVQGGSGFVHTLQVVVARKGEA